MDKHRKLKIKLAVVFISLTQGLQYSISPVLHKIQADYPGVSVNNIQMLITTPAILAMVIAFLSGWLVIKVSKKKILLFGAVEMGLCGFLPLLSGSFWVLFAFRTLLGIGMGIATALSTAVIAEHFEGRERVAAMGLQGASVGAGMLLSTTLGGLLGAADYRGAYLVHILGFISTVVIAFCLPDTGRVIVKQAGELKLNKTVYKICLLGFVEFLFLITFTTNIAMHLAGPLQGDAAVTGSLTGIFSGIQIVAGLVLSQICRITKTNTLPLGMLSYGIGSMILVLFPGSYGMLIAGAVFCGISQGIFMPRAMFEVAGAVKPQAAALAASVYTASVCIAQIVSPTVLNTLAKVIFGQTTTGSVYLICAAAMTVIPILLMIRRGIRSR